MHARHSTLWVAAALAMGLAATAQAATTRDKAQQATEAAQGQRLVPSGKGYGVPVNLGHALGDVIGPQANGIDYHGGPVMGTTKKGVKVYIIWYGNWAVQSPGGKQIVVDMLKNVTGTPYYNINSTYYQNNDPAQYVRNKVKLKGQIDDVNKSLGSALSDAAIKQLVTNAISSAALPKDDKGVYFVLTTKDVNATSGFCTAYCGWHSNATILGSDIKYSFVGDAARCINSCAVQNTSPNNNPGVDGMNSVIMHELVEAATDPDVGTGPYAWYQNSTGMENADKCSWTFGATQTAANGSKYNVTWGARQFMIQQNWVNASGGYCSMQYP